MLNVKLKNLKKELKATLFVFLLALSFGYISGFNLLDHSTDLTTSGIERNILGSELDDNSDALYFKMSKSQLYTIIHTHTITLGLVFLSLSLLLFVSSYKTNLKHFLMIEPFISLIVTFAGLWFLWHGFIWVKYIIMISGFLMHISFLLIILLLCRELCLSREV